MTDKCTIVLITLHADPFCVSGIREGGGTHSYVRELILSLASRGWPYTVITRLSNPSSSTVERVSRHGRLVRIRIGPVSSMNKRYLNDYHRDAILRVSESLTKYNITPTLFHSIYWNSGRIAMDLSDRLKMPFVHTVISNGMRRELEGATNIPFDRVAIERKVFQKAACIFSVSLEEKQDLISLYKINSEKIVVVGRLVNEAFITPAHTELGEARASAGILGTDEEDCNSTC